MRPIELVNFIEKNDDILVNDYTKVLDSKSCNFSYSAIVNLAELKDIQAAQVNQTVDILGKVRKIGEKEVVGWQKKNKQECVMSDGTATIRLVLWEENIESIKNDGVYKITNVSVKVAFGEKYLQSTHDTLIRLQNRPDLQELEIKVADATPSEVTVKEIAAVESVEIYRSCAHCGKKIDTQVKDGKKTIKCNKCYHIVLTAKCKKKLTARFYVQTEQGCRIHFTAFQDVLSKLLPGGEIAGDIENVEEEIAEKLLSFDNVCIHFNKDRVVQDLQFKTDVVEQLPQDNEDELQDQQLLEDNKDEFQDEEVDRLLADKDIFFEADLSTDGN